MEKELFLIADIGGYTRFLREQEKSLSHAQVAVAKLLEALMDSAQPFQVEKLEGDAVFLHLSWTAGAKDPGLLAAVRRMRGDFTLKQSGMLAARTCDCDSCSQMHKLTVKFVAHAGEAARQKVGPYSELAGMAVIVVHRMLKNTVPVREYLLGTANVLPLIDATPPAARLDQDFEGIGPTPAYYLDLSGGIAPLKPEIPKAPLLKRIIARVVLELRAMVFRLGLAIPPILKNIN